MNGLHVFGNSTSAGALRARVRACLLAAVVVFVVGCANEPEPSCGGPGASCDLEPTPACFEYPAGPYGVEEGDTLESFALMDCDGEVVSFDRILAQSELVLLNVGAGWCIPCIQETRTLEADVFRRFCGRGLRVVQVVFQDEDVEPATSLFCQGWRDRFGLTFPVLRDPLFTTQRFFDDHATQTPLNLLIDPDGVIVHREVGTDGEGLAARIDELLPP